MSCSNVPDSTFYVDILVDSAREFYLNMNGPHKQSGVDIPTPCDILLPQGEVVDVPLGVRVRCFKTCPMHGAHPVAFDLRPRSSISRPAKSDEEQRAVQLANGQGLIDWDYTGELHARLINVGKKEYMLCRGVSLVQLALEDLQLPNVVIIDKDDVAMSSYAFHETERGAGGFGSTGERGLGGGATK